MLCVFGRNVEYSQLFWELLAIWPLVLGASGNLVFSSLPLAISSCLFFEGLGHPSGQIVQYFGLLCRQVSHLFFFWELDPHDVQTCCSHPFTREQTSLSSFQSSFSVCLVALSMLGLVCLTVSTFLFMERRSFVSNGMHNFVRSSS